MPKKKIKPKTEKTDDLLERLRRKYKNNQERFKNISISGDRINKKPNRLNNGNRKLG